MKAAIVTCVLLFAPITGLRAQIRNKVSREQLGRFPNALALKDDVYSYSGETTPANFMMSGLPREGDIYWNVYDTRTGAMVLAWRAKIVRSPGLLGDSAVWVDNKYLVMPFGGLLDPCVIGVLPEN